jgi:hypothetical protein
MLLKGYIIKYDDEFQQMIIGEISKFHYSDDAVEKYLYCCKEYLLPDKINKYLSVETYDTKEIFSYSLLCKIINTGSELSEEDINRIFDFFDSISFVYTNPLYTHLMYFAMSSMNLSCIKKLVERGLTFDSPIIIELLFDKMRTHIISMQTQTEFNFNRKNSLSDDAYVSNDDRINCEFYKLILQEKRADLLTEFFTDYESDDETYDETEDKARSVIIMEKIDEIIQPFGIKQSYFTNRFDSNSCRMHHFIKRSSLIEFIELYKLLAMSKFDFGQKFTKLEDPTDKYMQLEPMTLYDVYMHGSFPIQVLYLDLHQELKYILCQYMIKCIKIFKIIPDVIIRIIINYV